jgi:hypothetical protein
MVQLTSLVLALTTTALCRIVVVPQQRDVSDVLAELADIDTATNSLTSTVNAWDGSLLGALSIQTAATAIGTQIDEAESEAETESVADSADSATVIAYITDTGEPDIAAALNALVARVADFESLGITSVVLSSLNSLKSKNDAYGATLLGITSSDQVANAQTALDRIDSDFDTAIAAFS